MPRDTRNLLPVHPRAAGASLRRRAARSGRGRHGLVLLALALSGAAVALWWQASTARDDTARVAWALLAAWCLPAVGLLCSARGFRAVLLACMVAIPLGAVPWVGLGALATTLLALPIATSSGVLALFAWAHTWAATVCRGTVVLMLVGVSAMAPSAACPDLSPPPPGEVGEQLSWLAHSDQADRRSACFVFNPGRDAQRRALVRQRMHAGQRLSAQALMDAGLVLLHGSRPDDLARAHALFAAAVRQGLPQAQVLEHAAADRLRLAQGLPQVHGTQWLHSP